MISIFVASVLVDDQQRAFDLYTGPVGFEGRQDVPPGGGHRWLTVASPAGPEGVELLLEPNAHPIGRTFQKGLDAEGIPATTLASDDLQADYERMVAAGVAFRGEPARMGPVINALFDDTCGTWIGLTQVVGEGA